MLDQNDGAAELRFFHLLRCLYKKNDPERRRVMAMSLDEFRVEFMK